ncbi:serine/threonine-protein kinase [Stenotrophomonas sp.]|uniref:serine/threonine-protein kinase n=1 Tax=Stenotrophomonas sp. TaxID=69392 RepID=UPI0028ADA632|nr:serine/threonine-protein kinase [Stenotrophomonas sp.]
MGSDDWRQLRDLFDAVCELPREQWQQALDERCDDPAIREEVLQLLRSQTAGLSRVSNRLDTALARALAPEFGLGDRLGPWRLTERIAQGGMGTVFKAERADGVYQRTVAIKLLHGMPGASEVERLGVERQVLAGLQLPNVARLYDGGTTPDGHPYLVMEYIDGVPLDSWCADHEMGLDRRLQLFLDICAIVQSAHEQLVLHCDLKPRNVLVLPNGQPVLLDFGLARLLNESREKQDAGYCTPAYASPELIHGQPVVAASDVYSLGVMLVELLTTRGCVRETQDVTTPVQVPSVQAPAALPWRRRLHGDLDAIAQRACALDVSERYRSVEALIAELKRYLHHQPVLAREGGRLYYLGKGLQRHWQGVAAVSGVMLLLLVFVTGLLQNRRQAQEEAAIARQISNFMVGMFETADPFLRTERGQEDLSSRQLLDKAALQVERDLRDAPVELARMQMVLGTAYQNSGVALQAEQLLQRAYEGFMQPGVDRPADAAAALASLSRLKTNEGNGALGEALAERGLGLLGRRPAADVEVGLLTAKALALTNQQHFDAAEAAYLSAQAKLAELPVTDGGAVSHELGYNQGLMYLRWGRHAAAEQAFRKVLEGLHGRRTSMALAAEMRLAQVFREQGNYAQALPLLLTGMKHVQELYGSDNSFVLVQHDALADLYVDMGNYPAAEAEFVARMALSEAIEGEDSVGYSMGLFNYAALHELRGDQDNAARMYQQALDIRRRKLGAEAPATLRAEAGMGRMLMRAGRMEEAGTLLLHAERGLSATLPDDAPGLQEARLYRSSWHTRQNELSQAQSLLDRLHDQVGPMMQAAWLAASADLEERRGFPNKALPLRQQVVGRAFALHGDDHLETANARVALAETLLQLAQPQAALAELAKAAPVIQRVQVAGAPDVRRVEGLELLARTSRAH